MVKHFTFKLSVFICLMMMASAAWADDFTDGMLTYTYTLGDDVCSVTKCNSSASGSLTIPASITVNGKTYSVTSIGDKAFCDCYELTSIIIPNSVTSIGYSIFNSCSSLLAIYVDENNVNYSSEEGILYDKQKTTVIKVPESLTSVTLPSSVTSIGSESFSCCWSLISVTIPNSVTSIGNSAFWWCSSLTSITIPNSVTSIGNRAFDSCSKLSSITIPDNVKSIGYYAFRECNSLSSINIPEGVSCIEDKTFEKCTSLSSITIPKSITRIDNNAFYNCVSLKDIYCKSLVPCLVGTNAFDFYSSQTLHVPIESRATYQAADGWKNFKNIVESTSVSLTSLGEGQSNVATFSSPLATTVPDGVKAYAITGTEGGYATTSVIEGDVIPANTGVLLASCETAASMAYTSAEGTAPAGNKLVATGGTSVAVTPAAGMKAFILANSSKGVGFYPLSTTNNTVPAYRAYLELPDGIASVRINFGDTATDIEAVEVATDTNAPVFDLSGRRVVKLGKPGLYVKGGVKFIVK